jgi:hypothetical protein
MTDTRENQLKDVTTMVEQQIQKICDEFNCGMQITRVTEATQRDLEATCLGLKTQLAAVKARTRHGGGGKAGTRQRG